MTNKDCIWFQVPENDRLYNSCNVRIVFETFSSRLLYISISRVRVFVFKSLKKKCQKWKDVVHWSFFALSLHSS